MPRARDSEERVQESAIGEKQQAELMRRRDDPLSQRKVGEHVNHEMVRGLGHPTGSARGQAPRLR